jgi:hypothetical protein
MDLVPVRALQDRVKSLKQTTFYEQAVDSVITAHEQGKLDPTFLSSLVEQATKELSDGAVLAVDFLSDEELEKRIDQRAAYADNQTPKLMIDPLDEKVSAVGPGAVALVLAPYSAGKGLFLCQIDLAYAMQGLRGWHITLEDPLELVGSRLDAALTGIPMAKLNDLPNRLKKRFRRLRKQIRGRIRITDGTMGGWTVSQIERGFEQLKQEGFTPDFIIVDYDEYIVCEKQFKGESARRFEYDDIYRRLTQLAAKLQVIIWTAAQATRNAEGKLWVTGKDAAEDISKIRKCFFAVGIGRDPESENTTGLYVCRHRGDKSRFGVTIQSNFSSGRFYDRAATLGVPDL